MSRENGEESTVCGGGNSIALDLSQIKDWEIRADIVIKRRQSKRLWGQVKDCNGKAVDGALVKLVKVMKNMQQPYCVGVAHTVTDCEGFYQFEVCEDLDACYKVLVGEAYAGCETVLKTEKGICNPCGTPRKEPCTHYIEYGEPCCGNTCTKKNYISYY